MPKTTDEEFDEIIQDALSRAAAVDCSKADYQAALRMFKGEIDTALDASGELGEEDAAQKGHESKDDL